MFSHNHCVTIANKRLIEHRHARGAVKSGRLLHFTAGLRRNPVSVEWETRVNAIFVSLTATDAPADNANQKSSALHCCGCRPSTVALT